MKTVITATKLFIAASICCVSCVSSSFDIGGNFIPKDQTFTPHFLSIDLDQVNQKLLDSLSGYSSKNITIGAIRDNEFGLTTRTSAFTLVPLRDTADMGTNPVFKSFYLSLPKDSTSVADRQQQSILQTVNVFELAEKLDNSKIFDINGKVSHGNKLICKSCPIINGTDSLCIDFTEEFGNKYINALKNNFYTDMTLDEYLDEVPGVYLEVAAPSGFGGRINTFSIQMQYDSDYGYLDAGYATLSYSAEWDGERKDTTLLFYCSPTYKFTMDSLFNTYSSGSYPQSCLNLTGNEKYRDKQKPAEEFILLEGGGGVKPCLSAKYLAEKVYSEISDAGYDPDKVSIIRASLSFPFVFPEDYQDMFLFPDVLSPTCRISTDTSAVFWSITDSSDSEEDQGDIDRYTLRYSPDITYHLQQLLKFRKNSQTDKLASGNYDVWFLPMRYEQTTTDTSDDELAQYYQELAYQSYYQSMYGGSYGGSDSYTNYYNYMMMAQYASSSTSTSTEKTLDKDSFYCAKLFGPSNPNIDKRPKLELTFVISND